MKKARVGIIGCGNIGTYHLCNLMKLLDIADLVGYCDIIPERAEAFVEKSGMGKAYSNYLDLLNDAQPDMVFICVPPYCHGEIEYELLDRKMPFFVEKPLHLDIEVAKDIANKVDELGLVTAVGFQCRYSNICEPNKEFIKNNKVSYVYCGRMSGIPSAPWWKVKDLSGGQIVEQTIHNFDMIRFMLGEPEEVFTMGTRGLCSDLPEGFDTDELSSTVIRFKSGILGCVSTGCYGRGSEAYDGSIVFSSAKARAEHKIIGSLKIYGDQAVKQTGGHFVQGDGNFAAASAEATVIADDKTAGVKCDRTFIEAAMAGDTTRVLSPYRDGLKSLAFTLACNLSMERGAPVKIDDLLA